jgi:hypothetical protein
LSNEDLLRPTLSDFTRVPALYHSTGFFLSAFFGGPIGAGLYALANTARLNRLTADGAVILIVAAAAFLSPLEIARQGGLAALGELLGMDPRRTGELLLRVLGLACFGAIYFRQRRFFRAATVAGVKPLPGWVPGIAAVVLGILANRALLGWILKHH